MKIILSAASMNIDAEIDPRFGRSAYLFVIDTDTYQWEAQTNPGANASGGAGIKAAQFAADQQAKAAISGDFGPNAFDALQAAGIDMYLYGDCHTVREAVERFKAGQLERVGTPTGPGHQGQGA